MEDTKIIELYWDRKESAIRETERKYENFCFSIAWNVLNNKEDSEECVNDTWFAAWKAIPPKRPAVLPAFLGRITRNFAIDRFRKKSAEKRMDLHMADISGEIEKIGEALTCTIEDSIREKEIVQIINDFLKKLSHRDRDMFLRRYWFMDSVRAVAKRHYCTESKVKSCLFRARKKLKKELEETL